MEAENLGKKLAKELARRQVEKQVRKDARESERIMTASRQRNPAIRLDQDDFKRRLGEAQSGFVCSKLRRSPSSSGLLVLVDLAGTSSMWRANWWARSPS